MSLDLTNIRTQITSLDRHILKLLSERHRLAFDVVRSKEITQKPLRDVVREKELLQELVNFAESENYQLDPQYVTQIFQRIIEDSVLTQQHYLQNKLNEQKEESLSIAFLGMRGSYSNMAARQFVKKYQGNLVELNCASFDEIFAKVEKSEADFGVLPLENTTSGSINEVYDLLQHTELSLVGELAYPIKHCLLTNGNVDLAEIDTIYTHSQPAQQCSQFIQSLDRVHIKYCESSSLYGLSSIKSEIANQVNNITRFIVVAKEAVKVSPQVQTKTLLLMTTTQQAGALVDALVVFKQFGIRMLKLESRPIYGKPWEEMFYVELEANMHNENTQKALEALKEVTSFLKVLGCYPSEIIEPVKI